MTQKCIQQKAQAFHIPNLKVYLQITEYSGKQMGLVTLKLSLPPDIALSCQGGASMQYLVCMTDYLSKSSSSSSSAFAQSSSSSRSTIIANI